jgi:hypothetical protein
MSFFSQRIFGAFKQKMVLFVMPQNLKINAMRSSLAITFAVAMSTFFVCDECAIEKHK